MKLTALLRMKKPEGGDAVNVEDLNDNFDILDEAIRLLEEFQGDVSNGIVHMDQATTRTNVANGDSLAVLFGKVMKWFSDLKSGAFADTVNNDTTADGGYVADARIVRTHGLEIDAIDNRVKSLETSFPGGCKVIAQAITAEGVTTAETASPSTMAANIAKIRNGGNLTETKYVPTGKTWYAGKQAYSGTGTDKGEVTLKPTGNNTATGGAGYYSKVIADGTAAYSAGYNAGYSAGNTAGINATKKGNAVKANVRNGYTFTSESAGVNQTGNMKELTGDARPSVAVSNASQNIAFSEAGYCDGVKVDSSAVYTSGYNSGRSAGYSSGYNDGSAAGLAGWPENNHIVFHSFHGVVDPGDSSANNQSTITGLTVGKRYLITAAGGYSFTSTSIGSGFTLIKEVYRDNSILLILKAKATSSILTFNGMDHSYNSAFSVLVYQIND